MKDFPIFLDHLTIEITYSYGHLYWDRCGQTVLDIETQCDGWFSMRDKKNAGRLENPENDIELIYTDKSLIFLMTKPEKLDDNALLEEVQKPWKIVRANFGLEEYSRLGCRFRFLKPTTSLDASEALIKRSELNVTVPDQLTNSHYDLNISQITTIFGKNDMEYRVELKGITRSRSIDPSGLYKERPETLSRNQKKYRLLKMKQLAEYSADPMYGVMLDVDCVNYKPEQVSVQEFIKNQIDIVRNDFLPILERL